MAFHHLGMETGPAFKYPVRMRLGGLGLKGKFVVALLVAAALPFVVEQVVLREGERLFAAVVTLVCLTEDGHAARLPAEVRARLSGPLH